MKHRVRTKKCRLCEQASEVLYRVKYQQTDWSFVCAICWKTLSKETGQYVYGGTWKAKKQK